MFTSTNPATGDIVATHEELTSPQTDAKLAKAKKAYLHWRSTSLDERTVLLTRLAGQYEANKEKLALMATQEMGKTFASSIAEVEKCAAAFRHYATNGPAMLDARTQKLSTGGLAEMRYLSLGVILAIMPWNFPYWQAVRFLAPTILAGNAGVLKHASIVQGCGQLMEEMVLAAGGPQGLFQNLAVKSKNINEIIADDRIAAVTLTGSEGAGIAVAAQAGQHLKKIVLELGGSDPFIVMPTADLGAAVPAAVKARIQNTGQSCICAKRMIIHTGIYDAFMQKFSEAMRAVKAGDPMDKQTDMGPLSSFEQRETVQKQLAEAKAQGAKLLFGGEPLDSSGAYLTAGILIDVPPGSALTTEEIFGPIAMVFKAKDIDEAITIANDIPYGLGSSVWTNDHGEKQKFINDIQAGMTAINQMLSSTPEAPFGGIKKSGHGRELGPYGLHEFMNLKTVLHPAA